MGKKREPISKKIRMEIFKRDSFTCQYCGRKSPDVILQVDHIHPVAKGGDNDIMNLITACFDCNSGKSDRTLSDHTAIEKKRVQIELLQERKEQIEMMFEWQKSLCDLDSMSVDKLCDYWCDIVSGITVSVSGKNTLTNLVKKFPIDEIIESMKIAHDYYVKYDKHGDPSMPTVEYAFNKLGGILYNRRNDKKNPELSELRHIRNILIKRFHTFSDHTYYTYSNMLLKTGFSIITLRDIAESASCTTWKEWTRRMEHFIDERYEREDK
jgi:hypothetical protein